MSVLGRLGLSASWSFSFCLSILLSPLTLFHPSPPHPVLALPYSLSPTFVFFAVCSSCSVFLHLSCSPSVLYLSCLMTVFLAALSVLFPVSCPPSHHLLSLPLFFQIGEERATAISLMRKFIAYQFTDTVSLDSLGRRERPKPRGTI